ANVTQSAASVRAADAGYNAALATGATVSFGFQASQNGVNRTPAAFVFNGAACSIAAGASPAPSPTSTPRPSPTPTPTPPPTPTPWPTASPAPAATSCQVTYRITSQWNIGFTADVTVRNSGPTLNGWALTWSFPDGQVITNAWNTSATQSGASVRA